MPGPPLANGNEAITALSIPDQQVGYKFKFVEVINDRDWRKADEEWIGKNYDQSKEGSTGPTLLGSGVTEGYADPRPAVADLMFKPRCDFTHCSNNEKSTEMQRLVAAAAQKNIEFQPGKGILTKGAVHLLENLADVLKEYPELGVWIISYPSVSDGKDKDAVLELTSQRSMAVKTALADLGVINDFELRGYGLDQAQHGKAKTHVIPNYNTPLINDPAVRLQHLWTKTWFDFLDQSAQLSEKGQNCSSLAARILQEYPHRTVFITLPKACNGLAMRRGEAIKESFIQFGVKNPIEVRNAQESGTRASVTFDDRLTEPEVNASLDAMLAQTPIQFGRGADRYVADADAILKRCATLINKVELQYLTSADVRIEVYPSKIESEDALFNGAVPLRRARRIMDGLLAEGVRLQFQCRGFPDAPADALITTGVTVRMSLVQAITTDIVVIPPDANDEPDPKVVCTSVC
eukprot:TRINITY_DN9407_c0_g1_i1.p1 TRINITY_DN9407_c0_g1~~TRINITY_DN9407_c0_g1_i1.p1  ORF type:complete len:464 (-),score=122.27 TRINITY_DN9407_c0_g1_i1:225-1616(-)